MLVIRRRPGESVFIGDEIEIEVLDAIGSQVKLGIRAPKAIPVARGEIRAAGRQNQAAAKEIPEQQLREILKKLKSPPGEPISPV
jgi:carbon storage regulator